MKRDPKERTLFHGIEVEGTRYKGYPTLFVAGDYNVEEILKNTKSSKAVYLGANQWVTTLEQAHREVQKAKLLSKELYVTIDFPRHIWAALGNINIPNVICMISDKSLDLQALDPQNYYYKLDDDVEDVQGLGVWVHPLSTLFSKETFTSWEAYKEDTV